MNTENEHSDSWVKASEPQLMMYVDCSGPVKLLPYAYLVEATFEKGDFVRLEFTSCVIEITGTGLAEMLPLVRKHCLSHLYIGNRIKEIKVSGNRRTEA